MKTSSMDISPIDNRSENQTTLIPFLSAPAIGRAGRGIKAHSREGAEELGTCKKAAVVTALRPPVGAVDRTLCPLMVF